VVALVVAVVEILMVALLLVLVYQDKAMLVERQ
jgi:hypothetical protein